TDPANPLQTFVPNIAAIAAAGPTTFYALNQSNGSVQLVLLRLSPQGAGGILAGQFTGTVISDQANSNLIFFQPVAPVGADIQPGTGLLYFAARTAIFGETHLFVLNPTVADAGTPQDEVAATLEDRGEIVLPFPQQNQNPPPPNVGTIAFLGADIY